MTMGMPDGYRLAAARRSAPGGQERCADPLPARRLATRRWSAAGSSTWSRRCSCRAARRSGPTTGSRSPRAASATPWSTWSRAACTPTSRTRAPPSRSPATRCRRWPGSRPWPSAAWSATAARPSPPGYRGNLFSAQHNARAVGRHVLVPDGSTFRSRGLRLRHLRRPRLPPLRRAGGRRRQPAGGRHRGVVRPALPDRPHPRVALPRRDLSGPVGGRGAARRPARRVDRLAEVIGRAARGAAV